MASEIQIGAFSVTCLLITAVICIAAVFAAWYTVRSRIKLSQIILGIFSYILVMLLENVFSLLLGTGLPESGLRYGISITLRMVLARELIRFLAMRFGVRGNFEGADAALGFALGFAGAYLLVCAAYYFNCYTAASEFVKNGADAFVMNTGADAAEALTLLETIAGQEPWQFIATGANRVFFLVREMALCVLLWYAMEDRNLRIYYLLVPVMSLIAMLPDGLFQAEVLLSAYLKDALTCVISGGIAFLAARKYNAREDQVAHFQVEKLRTRRRR